MAEATEHGFTVKYVSDEDAFRWLTVDPSEADMTGWRVEVGDDPDWYRENMMMPHHAQSGHISEFVRESLWGIGERWAVPVDWGERIVRWIPPPAVSNKTVQGRRID